MKTVDYRCTCAAARGNPRRLCGVNHPDCAALRAAGGGGHRPGPAALQAMAGSATAAGEDRRAVPTAQTSVSG